MRGASQDAVFQRRSQDYAEDWDWLVAARSLGEEVQVAAVSVFLSFGPFQTLKRTTQRSREIILLQRGDGQTNVNVRRFSWNLFRQCVLT
jgi:hypothetical protein